VILIEPALVVTLPMTVLQAISTISERLPVIRDKVIIVTILAPGT
jgi:hypothetical protein